MENRTLKKVYRELEALYSIQEDVDHINELFESILSDIEELDGALKTFDLHDYLLTKREAAIEQAADSREGR